MTASSIEKSPTLRHATEADLPAVAEIYAHYVAETVSTFEFDIPDQGEWRQRFASITATGLPFLVAEFDGRIAGYAYCGPWKQRPAYRNTVENSIYLAPWATGRGLGGILLDALLIECRALGIREIIAVIADSGDPSSPALHRSRGFVEAGRLRRVGHKHDRWLDTILMQRSV
ncbi:GNAT family N-acetyltransferase [Nocardia sp. CDC159]|uniref:GNAT family N-acetyltransferase n=1 Tax=Nocardia pulmonis TaxID=2951408 RepID=A0A9X2IVK3_9NOCA|nr:MULTISPECIES: GNAT family N-acetyltransferase [Nocardia]MCM6773303.1 GNAT family N-acetyltransferase [Nocardia pulmonis]MCM6786190.1 GNAT family N-acetyltransferase [Nocardia sp. CDC159]